MPQPPSQAWTREAVQSALSRTRQGLTVVAIVRPLDDPRKCVPAGYSWPHAPRRDVVETPSFSALVVADGTTKIRWLKGRAFNAATTAAPEKLALVAKRNV